MNKPYQALEMNTKAIEENGKAVTEMVNLLRAKVIQLCSQLSDGQSSKHDGHCKKYLHRFIETQLT